MSNLRETSLQAYYGEVLPNLGDKQRLVLSAIVRLQPCTDQQIGKILNIPINSVTPRRGELDKKGLIVEWGKRQQNGRQALTWVTMKWAVENGFTPDRLQKKKGGQQLYIGDDVAIDRYQELFEYMHDEHNVILLQTDMQDIVHICKKIKP